jgi:EpsD family peptidyl-prolyl cis-trans isomerase
MRMKQKTLACSALSACALLLSACGNSESTHEVASQVAARVGGQEITVHQINAALSRMGQVAPEQLKQAGSAVLERLIDQELMLIQVAEQKIDRDPAVMQALDAARREILARAYVERITGQVDKADRTEVSAFYKENPELFSRRRLYALQELSIIAPAERRAEIRSVIEKSAGLEAVTAWLRRENISFTPSGGVKPAEELPMEALRQLSAMRDGQTGIMETPNGLLAVHLSGSREQPLDEAAATPMIERFLANQSKTQRAQEDLRSLRERAKIEYVGDYAAPQAAAATPAVAAAPAENAASAASSGAPNLSPSALEKGAGGLK